LLLPGGHAGIQVMLKLYNPTLDQPFPDPRQPSLLALNQVGDSCPAGVGPRVLDGVPPLEHFCHRGGKSILSLMRIPPAKMMMSRRRD
jgi:hypothetical protein